MLIVGGDLIVLEKINIGCSGYYYSNWKEKFYPTDLAPAHWLEFYAMFFNTVELNSTFYRMPRKSSLEKYAALTPDDFSFAVKVNKYITHILRLGNARKTVNEFQTLVRSGLGEKLSVFLFQLPPSFRCTDDNLERVLNAIPEGPQNVVEFRHSSWWKEEIAQRKIRDHGITFCNVDFPGLETPFINSGQHFYMRYHGSPVLFTSAYPKETLQQFVSWLPKNFRTLGIYFNNTMYDAGLENASEVQMLVQSAFK